MASADESGSGWHGFLRWLEAVSLRLTPLVVLLALFACVILTVRWLRPPPRLATPVIVLGPEVPTGVERKVFAADSLFDFGSKTLNPASAHELDEFGARLKAAGVEQIVVVGHTDRIGTQAVNNELSQGRANAVRDAILKNAGIDPAAVLAVGIGDRMPVTTPAECPGSGRDGATIACLSKDRRVEVWTKAAAAKTAE